MKLDWKVCIFIIAIIVWTVLTIQQKIKKRKLLKGVLYKISFFTLKGNLVYCLYILGLTLSLNGLLIDYKYDYKMIAYAALIYIYLSVLLIMSFTLITITEKGIITSWHFNKELQYKFIKNTLLIYYNDEKLYKINVKKHRHEVEKIMNEHYEKFTGNTDIKWGNEKWP